ncbi:MAG TPA: 16S rRNA (adenine(1518)-N(6)/adenine(1519)-N(6))-dimethyltransferase RsmA [Firmicutes bacterium]|nr:16S rRNA (adenine(1518)-N(6)/adenine(1519)-N(6))-dimethyltransferase RsmA [Bacillota bacterium]
MSHITSPSYITRLMKKWGFSTKKRFGQNFLIDQNIVERIIACAQIQEGEWALEIGPGLGALTVHLADQAAHVVAMEIDTSLVAILRDTLQTPKATIWEGDALEADWRKLLEEAGWQGQPLRLVANLPYYLTSPLIMKALESALPFASMVVMVQKEVALRMLAEAGSKDFGILSLAVQYYAKGRMAMNVPRTVFLPSPAVDSAVVELIPRTPPVDAPRDELFAVIRAGFGQRRKTLRNALKTLMDEWPAGELSPESIDQALLRANIDPTMRAERLSLEEFSVLTKELLKGV